MHTAIASSHTLPRRAPAIERSTQAALSLVTIDVTVHGTSSAAGRRALLAALGEGSRLFVMTVDKRNDAITFRVDVMARSVGDVIGALAGVLHRATIGRVRSIALPQHAAQQH